MKIFIDIGNAAKIMLLGKGSSLAVGSGRGFISIIKSTAPVGTALASTTLQAKPAWGRGKAKTSFSMYIVSSWEKKEEKKVKVHSSSPFQ